MASSEAEFYRAYGVRISANTGLPQIISNLHENEQRDGGIVARRVRDNQELFNTLDPGRMTMLLAQYGVDYVYVGPVERALYAADGLAKFDQLGGTIFDSVYATDGVTIYRVRPEALASQPLAPGVAAINDIDPALEALRAQLAANPTDASTAFGMAGQLLAKGKPDEAAAILQRAAVANPNDVPLHHLLGDALVQSGRPDAAIGAWQQAIAIDGSANNYGKLGLELTRLRRYAEAEATLVQALAVDANALDPRVYLAELYLVRNADGDRERARERVREYLAIAPADATLHQRATELAAQLNAP